MLLVFGGFLVCFAVPHGSGFSIVWKASAVRTSPPLYPRPQQPFQISGDPSWLTAHGAACSSKFTPRIRMGLRAVLKEPVSCFMFIQGRAVNR